jgi:anaerobic selenocysteine-containing dehydrogenase
MDETNPLTRVSRRTVVQGAAAVAAAGTATLALAGTAQAATTHSARSETQADAAAGTAAGTTVAGTAAASGDGLVVHVRDVRTGELDVYSGERHTAVRDPKLAKLLAALAR